MSEPTSETQGDTVAAPTVAEKRKVLQDAGVAVGTRGKLSADHEAEYARLTSHGTPVEA